MSCVSAVRRSCDDAIAGTPQTRDDYVTSKWDDDPVRDALTFGSDTFHFATS
jgi:hypothetical protein